MTFVLRGALIEYGSDFLGPLPNVVIFQFNPDSLSRTIEIPERPSSSTGRETSQAGDAPTEKISLEAYFDASDKLGTNDPIARVSGVGPQLAALEKMAQPSAGLISGAIGAAIDAVGDLLSGGSDKGEPSQPVPRVKYPRILFIWGYTKVLPVIIDSMSITEQRHDALLNPIEAKVNIGLSVVSPDSCSDDIIAKGASEFTGVVKEALAVANLAVAAGEIIDIISF